MSGSKLGGGSSSSSASSRRGKKGGGHISDNPKQPQRGLGVAQLEKIRIHSQLEEMNMQAYSAMQTSMGGAPPSQFAYPSSQSPTSPYGYPHHMMMGFTDMEGSNLRFGESQSCNQPRWNPSQVYPDNLRPYDQHSTATRHFLDTMEDPGQSTIRNFWMSMNGSSTQDSGSSDSQDLDLELRL